MLLNPLMLCGILNPVPGVLVCAGDKLSFCSSRYRTVDGDTCASIKSLGTVVGLPAGASCAAALPTDTEVCLAPAANEVRAFKLHAPCREWPALRLLRLLAHGPMPSLRWQPRLAVKLHFVGLQCAVDSLCGVPLSTGMKDMLGQIPDWCSVLKECKVNTVNVLFVHECGLCLQLSGH